MMYNINNMEEHKIYDFFYQSSKQLKNQISKMCKQKSTDLRFFTIRIMIRDLKRLLRVWMEIKTHKVIAKHKIVYLDKQLKYCYYNLRDILDYKKAEYPDIKYPKGIH